jgi:hypothetical protein
VEALVRSHRTAREGHVRGWVTVIQLENLRQRVGKVWEVSDRRSSAARGVGILITGAL